MMLDAYICGTELGRTESHTLFTGLSQLMYFCRTDKPIVLAQDPHEREHNWPELDIYPNTAQVRDYLNGLQGSLLKVSPTSGKDLDVELCGHKLEKKPIAVSLSKEKLPGDSKENYLVVFEYNDKTEFSESFLDISVGERTLRLLPIYNGADRFKEFPHKVTLENGSGLRALLITRSVNLQEIVDDHAKIKQLFVVGTPNEAKAEYIALTEGKIISA